MVPPRPAQIRQTLAERVARRAEGHGITRASVDAAVRSVLGALRDATTGTTDAAPSEMIAAFSARSMPDLASRVRGALAKEGVEVGPIGIAVSGNHNVATLRLPLPARAAAERVASGLKVELVVLPEEGAK